MTSDPFRQAFLGRYEERGDDYDIVDLEVKNVERPSVDRRLVTIQQQWVVEPNMTVNKEKFIEVWERFDSGWALTDRMRRREWRRRQTRTTADEEAEETEPAAETDDQTSTPGPPDRQTQ